MLRRTLLKNGAGGGGGVRHLTKASDLSAAETRFLLNLARDVKTNPGKYASALAAGAPRVDGLPARATAATLLMLFEKPSLRTRVSFEVGMTQMGGHGLFYSVADSPLGKKETIEDTVLVLERYCDLVMARVNSRLTIRKMAELSTKVPIINALDDWAHPCQNLTDLLTIAEHMRLFERQLDFSAVRFCYCGDLNNNVTMDSARGMLTMGGTVALAGPRAEGYDMEKEFLDECDVLAKRYGGKLEIYDDALKAAKGADIVYTDSWQSYHIPKNLEEQRIKMFTPFRVTDDVMAQAKKTAKFMNCLPASRAHEQTASVIDGPQSIVFDQAENRLHSQKALMLWLAKAVKM